MQTTSTSQLFQSDAQHLKQSYRAAKFELHKTTGNPIELASKPLRVVVRQTKGREAEAWIAESGFMVRRVGLESGKTKQIYRGHSGPVTCLDFYTIPSSPPRPILISGSWDKSFRIWDIATKTLLSTTIAHADFVKALHIIPSLNLLITGSSDKSLKFWDLTELSSRDFTPLLSPSHHSTPSAADDATPVQTGAAPIPASPLAPLESSVTLKEHTRPIECLASFEILDEDEMPNGRFGLFSADSMGALKSWEIWREGGKKDREIKVELRGERRDHELGIYDLVVRGSEGELWTASADNSLLLSTFSPSSISTPLTPLLRIPHTSPLKSLLSLSHSLPSLNSNIVITGASDELIRLFDVDSLLSTNSNTKQEKWAGIAIEEKDIKGCLNALEGHSHEIIQISSYLVYPEGAGVEAWILTASLDGTLRRWKWSEMREKQKLPGLIVEVNEEEVEATKEGGGGLMTEEEERELEELMADD